MAKILIVDDSRTMRKMLRGMLTEAGHEVVAEAGNGAEAMKSIKEFMPDLVTLDITMPEMDGLTCLKLIKTDFPQVKVIMVSAAGQKEKVLEALKCGASDFLQKPFENENAINVINKIVG